MGRPKGYDRNEVLRLAMQVFWDKGYEGAHLRELVEVTGISRFSLYQEFGGKEGLFEEALSSYIEQLGDLTAILSREPLGIANIRSFYRALIEFGFRHGCFAINTIREKYVVPESAYATVEQLVEGVEEAYRRNLEAGREAGELPFEVDIAGLAKLLAAVNIGLLSYGIVSPDRDDAARMIDSLERLWS